MEKISKEEIDSLTGTDEIDAYEGKSKDELKKIALDEFEIDGAELEKAVEQESKFSKETKDEMANIEFFAEKLEMSLVGKSLQKTGKNEEKYVQTDKAVAGASFIRAVVGIVKTFATKSLLIAKKEEKVFYMQFEDAWFKISDMILERKHNVSVINARAILKEVKDTFWNLGGILLSTGGNMAKWFGNLDDKYSESEKKLRNDWRD